MEGLVMILDVQGKVLDSNSSSVTEIHPLHRRWIDSGMGRMFPEIFGTNFFRESKKDYHKTTELIRFSLNDTSPEVSHEYRIVPHSSKTALCVVREIHDEIKPDERREKFHSDYQALLNALAELVFRTTRDGVIKEFFIPQGWEIGLKRKIQKENHLALSPRNDPEALDSGLERENSAAGERKAESVLQLRTSLCFRVETF